MHTPESPADHRGMRPEAAMLPQWARYSPVAHTARLSQAFRVRIPTQPASSGANTRCPDGATVTPLNLLFMLTVAETSTQ
eukprot:7376609-Prymnesium_polylepis.3